MSGVQQDGALAGAALLLVALALAGCSTSISEMPIGSASSESRANETSAYLPVNALPPDRDEAAMDPAERAKVQKELLAARDHQASAAAAKGQGQANDQTQNQAQAQAQAGK
jgi:hypothetical protein